jgi:hypothetical protein
MPDDTPFDRKRREGLFLELAGQTGGIAVRAVYETARERGDQATEEAYYNLARRLEHRGLIVVVRDDERPKKYSIGQSVDAQWLEEEDLADLVSDEYPLLTLPIWREAQRQINEVPEELWIELRERLSSENAQDLFAQAVESYCADLDAAFKLLCHEMNLDGGQQSVARQKEELRNTLQLLQMLVRYGLGISKEAVSIPSSIDVGLAAAKNDADATVVLVNADLLRDELSRRVSDEPFVAPVPTDSARAYLTAAVDGSTRGGMMFSGGPEADFFVGHSPMITVNTCVGQINRSVQIGGQRLPAFMRLPEKPEDMQQRDNRYTFMAKIFYPDLSDAKYMHAVWNAMDALEARVTLRILGRWTTSNGKVEVPPSDVVLRDGTVSPQDRDFAHYRDLSTYGRIVRDCIETNWDIARKSRDDAQTVAGVVKTAQLRVFGPILSWYAARVAARDKRSLLATWPMRTLNLVPDQVLLTRLLTAGRRRGEQGVRTCIVLRPFHALTERGLTYSRARTPADAILGMQKEKAAASADEPADDDALFWRDYFRGDADPFVQMLKNVWYGNFFLGAVPRLDAERYLPRIELLLPASTAEEGAGSLEVAKTHVGRLLEALQQHGFEVSLEHSMFRDRSYVEVLPALLVRVHETVKIWAQELMSRVQEYVGTVLSRYVQTKRMRNLRVRPFSRAELQVLLEELKRDRKTSAGDRSSGVIER